MLEDGMCDSQPVFEKGSLILYSIAQSSTSYGSTTFRARAPQISLRCTVLLGWQLTQGGVIGEALFKDRHLLG